MKQEVFKHYNKLYRDDGPAEIWYNDDGSLYTIMYYTHGKIHRADGPAYILYNNQGQPKRTAYYLDDVKTKEIGYYDNGKIKYIIYYDNNKKHKLDGPAFIVYNTIGDIEQAKYYLKDKEYNKKDYYAITAKGKTLKKVKEDK